MKNKKILKKKEEDKGLVKKFLSFLLHIGCITILGISFYPLAKLYFNHLPPMGGDFYQFSTYISYFHRFLTWPHLAWKYVWYNGVPTLFDYPWLHVYLASPLMNFFTSVEANEIYSLLTLFLYFVFSYLLFYKLSKNKILSVFLSSLLVWSRSTYVALFFGGNTAFSCNLMLAPLVFYFLMKYLEANKRKLLFLTAFFGGLSVIGHQGMSILFIIIPSFIVLLFHYRKENKFFARSKLKDMGIYFIISFFVGILGLYPYILAFLGSLFGFETQMGIQTSSWPRKEALNDLLGFTNPAIYLALVLVVIFVLIQGKLYPAFKKSLSFISLVLYIFLFELLMFLGKNPFSETLGADRAYWFFPLVLGGVIAIFFKEISKNEMLKKKVNVSFIFKSLIILALGVSLIFIPDLFWFIKEKSGLARLMIPAQNLMVKPSEENKKKVVPDWLETSEKNYRLHTFPGITLWWNTLYDLPVTTGFADPQGVKAKSWSYWRDISITSEAVEHFRTPSKIAENNAYFMIDWYAIKYLESSPSGYPPADYLFENPEFIEKEELMKEATFHFYQAKEKYISPIIRPTNSPTILVVSSQEAYNSLLRVLAQENLNSKYVIPIHYSQYLEDLTKIDLSVFDSIFLYDYHYRKEKNFKSYPQKPWQKLLDYVKNGGTLFIETGSEVKESDIKNLPVSGLPEVFPIKTTSRGELGTDWHLSISQEDFLKGVKTEEFDQLIYQDSPWKLSYTSPDQLKPWAQTILAQKEKPILVSGNLEKGQVIWSGLNLPYHIKSYNNIAEGKLLRNILKEIIGLQEEEPFDFEITREKSEHIIVKGSNFKGILFKESNYKGWRAKVKDEKKDIMPLSAGPGFMYFPLSHKSDSKITINIDYQGSLLFWIFWIVGIIITFYLLLYLFLGSRLTSWLRKLFRIDKFKSQILAWWSKEEI